MRRRAGSCLIVAIQTDPLPERPDSPFGRTLAEVRFVHFVASWSGLLAWISVGSAAFVAVALAIRAEAKNLRAWTRGRRTATGPSGNVGQ